VAAWCPVISKQLLFNTDIPSILRGYLGDITSLKIRKATRDRLGKIGNKTETYDDVLNRLMDFYEKNGKRRMK
jgi:hypothetical protein